VHVQVLRNAGARGPARLMPMLIALRLEGALHEVGRQVGQGPERSPLVAE